MCHQVTCSRCGKATWVGCGLHVEAALRGVPPEQRCQCPWAAPPPSRTAGK